jgi:tRNA threonylcarbamoyladenosine biosynthesis protein TsaE
VEGEAPPTAASGTRVAEEPALLLNEGELIDWGRAYGARLTSPATIAISGDLGAGKTVLVRAICEGYGVEEQVTSPTFALVHRYDGERGSVCHMDLFRLSGPRECAALGLAELLEEDALVLIEWPERAAGLLPHHARRMRLEHLPHDISRRALHSTE